MERWEAEPGDSTEAGLDLGCCIQHLKVEGVGRGRNPEWMYVVDMSGLFCGTHLHTLQQGRHNTPVKTTSKEVMNTPAYPPARKT